MSGFRKRLLPGELTPRQAIEAVRQGRLKRQPLTAIDSTIDVILMRAVEREYGERCPDFDADCPTCRAWGELDALRAKAPSANDRALAAALALDQAYAEAEAFDMRHGGDEAEGLEDPADEMSELHKAALSRGRP